ncbi:hypothetical protein [Umezawaea sp. Da 62-37]|uniref:hypothetical protein n=1 Tax=Umezawaea sp. Da 62-37 TaxID=3075927 RepID=UPI0028F6C11F|nr:hypothetical protein [Umezawaea sp. Da 62-37]WNV84964.1 hypothetical protein RM788_43550 [Umezawaea sp. Da 62-37]
MAVKCFAGLAAAVIMALAPGSAVANPMNSWGVEHRPEKPELASSGVVIDGIDDQDQGVTAPSGDAKADNPMRPWCMAPDSVNPKTADTFGEVTIMGFPGCVIQD